jgi:hypothetical protein
MNDARHSGLRGVALPFVKGERVLYRGQHGQEEEVVVASVDTNVAAGEDPFVAVRMPTGTVRDTTFERLRKMIRP